MRPDLICEKHDFPPAGSLWPRTAGCLRCDIEEAERRCGPIPKTARIVKVTRLPRYPWRTN